MQFEVSDATKRRFPDAAFDVVYSRDTILHIRDKLDLFGKFYVSVLTGKILHVCIHFMSVTEMAYCIFLHMHIRVVCVYEDIQMIICVL